MAEETENQKTPIWSRFGKALSKTREQVGSSIGNLLLTKKTLDPQILDDLQTELLIADVGVEVTEKLINNLQRQLRRKRITDGQAVHDTIRDQLFNIVDQANTPFTLQEKKPFVILVVGVNGVGKTTTIGKLARLLKNQGKSVLLAAGDTYRAAAIEQLQAWGEKSEIPVIAQQPGADSASVIFDAIQAAQSRDIDVVLADTAGRLQNKEGLMAELTKVTRVIEKVDETAPHETLLVLDAGVGQNAISQVREFKATTNVTGLIITKLDGTAKAGVLVAIAAEQPLPLYFVGVGEGEDDLTPFDARAYIDGLLPS